MLTIKLLGPMEVRRDGQPVALPQSKKTRALLAYLALTGRGHRRERLCELLWDVPDDPRGALRWSLSKLRGLINDEEATRLVADRETVAFQPEATGIDILTARARLTAPAADQPVAVLKDMERLFTGDLLEGLDLPNQLTFQSWCVAEREEAQALHARLLDALIGRLDGDGGAALPYARKLSDVRPLDEEARARLIRLLVATGRHEEAEQQVEINRRHLEQAGVSPSLTAQSLKADVAPREAPDRQVDQQIRFCQAADGVRIAYASVGQGPPLVKTANWLNHLEYDWESPVWRHLFRALTNDHTLVRYDERGNGLSDWTVDDLSLEACVADLETVVNAAGLERFSLLGISQGCAISILYANRHPERVDKMILHGGYAAGWRNRANAQEIARREATMPLIELGWGQENPAFRQLFTTMYIPDGSPEQLSWFNDLQRITTSPENAVRLLEAFSRIDVRDELAKVRVPTLVMHSRRDAGVPFEAGRELAISIPGARFVPLDSANHLILEHEPAWPRMVDVIRGFLDERS